MDYRPLLVSHYDISATSFRYYEPGEPILQYKLLLKQHYETGISYLCITKQKNYIKYTGSGKSWKKLLNKIPSRILTTLLYTTEDKEELSLVAAFHSLLYNIPHNKDFANLVPELGYEFNQGNLPEWVKNATPEQLKNARNKQSASIRKTNAIKRNNGEKSTIEIATQKLFEETGLSNFMQIAEVAAKCRDACKTSLLEKYGVDNNMKIPEVAAKVAKSRKATMLERYDVENIMELKEHWVPARAKAISTMISKYGVSNISQTPGFKERVGPNISAGLIARPKVKCKFCDFETKNYIKHERECKLNPNRIPLATIECEYCGIESINGNYKRWHGINCKHNPTKGN